MVILALETVTRAGSLALFTDRGPGPAMVGDPARPHGVRLPDELLRFVAADGRTLRDVDCFAVVTGPGSFTGLRVGLATVQGLALAHDRLVIGIPTLEAMTSGWLDERAPQAGVVVACLDAARGDVFYAAYDVTGADTIETARLAIEARVATPEAAASQIVIARGAGRAALTGDGAERYASAFRVAAPGARIDVPMPNLAAAAARLAARRLAAATPPHALRPIYVRRPDAELARERAGLERSSPVRSESLAGEGEQGLSIFEVRAAGDVAEVGRLQGRAFGDAWGAEVLGSELANNHVARLYAARLPSGELAAYCAGWEIADELHINSVAVDPRYRRQGIAGVLLRRVMALAAAAGATGATLEVRESNGAARALYEGLGFRVEGVRRGYYQNPGEDALVLWRRGLLAAVRDGL